VNLLDPQPNPLFRVEDDVLEERLAELRATGRFPTRSQAPRWVLDAPPGQVPRVPPDVAERLGDVYEAIAREGATDELVREALDIVLEDDGRGEDPRPAANDPERPPDASD
jgi:hypothetical protein